MSMWCYRVGPEVLLLGLYKFSLRARKTFRAPWASLANSVDSEPTRNSRFLCLLLFPQASLFAQPELANNLDSR